MSEAKEEKLDVRKKKKKPRVRSSAKAIILRDGSLLAQRCDFGDGIVCYLLPGGGQKFGESLHDALRREVLEETGAEIEIGPLVWIRDYIGRNHEFAEEDPDTHQVSHYFLCELVSGPDGARASNPDSVQVGLNWIPLTEVRSANLYPKALKARFSADGWIEGEVYAGDVN